MALSRVALRFLVRDGGAGHLCKLPRELRDVAILELHGDEDHERHEHHAIKSAPTARRVEGDELRRLHVEQCAAALRRHIEVEELVRRLPVLKTDLEEVVEVRERLVWAEVAGAALAVEDLFLALAGGAEDVAASTALHDDVRGHEAQRGAHIARRGWRRARAHGVGVLHVQALDVERALDGHLVGLAHGRAGLRARLLQDGGTAQHLQLVVVIVGVELGALCGEELDGLALGSEVRASLPPITAEAGMRGGRGARCATTSSRGSWEGCAQVRKV
jgi:hypothetical protein